MRTLEMGTARDQELWVRGTEKKGRGTRVEAFETPPNYLDFILRIIEGLWRTPAG